MNIETIKIAAAICSILGSVILAYRVTGILSALSLVAKAHEINIQQLMPNYSGDIDNVTNSHKHVERAQKMWLLIVGFIFMFLSGALQLIALIIVDA